MTEPEFRDGTEPQPMTDTPADNDDREENDADTEAPDTEAGTTDPEQ